MTHIILHTPIIYANEVQAGGVTVTAMRRPLTADAILQHQKAFLKHTKKTS